MESGVVRRRTYVIAAHLASHEDLSAAATHLFPMSCSNSLNSSVIPRRDNRTNFARQGSSSQGCFMRQASTKEVNSFQPNVPSESTNCGNKGSSAFDAPMFSRPTAKVEPSIPCAREIQSEVQGCRYTDPAPEAPAFARPSQICGNSPIQSQARAHDPAPNSRGLEWKPRMDVTESGFSYAVTLEIPGVSIDNIKVEVNNQSLIVTGKRSSFSCGASLCSNKLTSSYHRREIVRGPYRVMWPLPNNADKENVSAEIQDGLLRITIPKLSGLRWLRKAHM